MTLIERLRKRAEIRRSIPRSEPDRIADICEEAADEIERLYEELYSAQTWYDSEYPPDRGHDQVYPWD